MADNAQVHPEQGKRKSSMDNNESERSRSVVIKFPKDQILREAPSMENHHHGRKNPTRRRSKFCCCFAWFFGSVLSIVVMLLIIAGILYLVFTPRLPNFSVERLETRSFNFSRDSGLSSEFYIAVLDKNRNSKIGIYYKEDNSLGFSYSGVELCSGSFPGFYQGHGNVTLLETSLIGSNVPFSEELYLGVVSEENEKRVPLEISINMPVRIKAGLLKLPKMTVRVRCSIIVSGLSANQESQIESLNCKVKKNVF
ncbi:hypothetical protein SUGI_1108420 [Cryptomeria japonica]|uniref:NDR1/HIN1-like protein 6 n=1 Tax=Cryptomeria japonica TaxID=3369 RepID=UPI002414932A|nr:NDR1/HIN1-like protein 6 [Cryptomeria japonica]GLJ52111.1 hypothetical protein SUGI_1108420 [Cryptomeria japonica]